MAIPFNTQLLGQALLVVRVSEQSVAIPFNTQLLGQALSIDERQGAANSNTTDYSAIGAVPVHL